MINEQRLGELMRSGTEHVQPSPDLLIAAKRAGVRRRRISVAGATVAAVVALGGTGAAAAEIHASHAHSGTPAAVQQTRVGWYGSWRVGSADSYWKTGPALAKQLRALDHAPRPAGTKADWYVYGTSNGRRFVLDNVGSRLYLTYLTAGQPHAITQTLPLAFIKDISIPLVVQLNAQFGSQYLAVQPQSAISYQLKGQAFRSVGRNAALIPRDAAAVRAVQRSRKTTMILGVHHNHVVHGG